MATSDSSPDTQEGPGCEPRSGDLGSTAAWLALLALAGLALARFWRLGEWGLWIDEAHTLHDAMATSRASQSYPLGYWATRLAVWLRSGNISEWTLRLPAALFGALALPLGYWAFRPFVGARRAALTAVLVGASTWHLYWSQSARAYTLALDLSLLGSGLWARGLWLGQRRAIPLGLGLALLALFAHPSAAMLLLALLAAPWILSRWGADIPLPRPSPLVRRALWLGLLAVLVWAVRVVLDYEDAKGSEGQRFSFWIGSWKHLLLTTGFYVTPWLASGALLGGLYCLRPHTAVPVVTRDFDRLAACVVATVLACALAMAVLVRVSAQYVFVLLPWIAVLATAPLDRIKGWARPAYIGALVVPGLVLSGLYFGPGFGNRPRWREAYAHVFAEREAHDLVFGMAAVVGQYYLDPGSVSLRDQRDLVRLNSYTAREPARWSRRGRRTWFVVRREDLGDWPAEDRAAFEQLLREECRLTLRLPVSYTPRDLSVEVYVREPWGVRPIAGGSSDAGGVTRN